MMHKFNKPKSVGSIFFTILCFIIFSTEAQTIRQDRPLESFEDIVIDASASTYVFIEYHPSSNLVVKADRSVIKEVKTVVSGNTLKIYFQSKQRDDTPVEIHIRLPLLKKIILSGEGNVEFKQREQQNLLQTGICNISSNLSV